MMVYRDGDGFSIERLDRATGTVTVMPVSEADLAAIAARYGEWRSALGTVNVLNAKPGTAFQRSAKASPAPGNSPSSPARQEQKSLL